MLDLLRILLRWRVPLLTLPFVAALVTAAVAWRLEPRYYSEASVLPPADDPGFGPLAAILQQAEIPVPGGVSSAFLPTLYASIVGSRWMAARIVADFDLVNRYKATNSRAAMTALRKRTRVDYTEEGIFLIGCQDEDAERAATMVNAYVRYLDQFIREANSGRAADVRRFVEGQVELCKTDLVQAEEGLRDFQRQHRAFEIGAQTEGALAIAAELEGKIMVAEVELGVLRQHGRADAPEVRNKETELRSLREAYERMTGAERNLAMTQTRRGETSHSVFPAVDSLPDMALQYARLLREVKTQSARYTVLVQQVEQARFEEQKNTRVLAVLDPGVADDQPVFPRRLRMMAFAMLAVFIWVAAIAVLVEKLRERPLDAGEGARLGALRREWERMPGWVRSLERLVVR